jgi:hypothetical protein
MTAAAQPDTAPCGFCVLEGSHRCDARGLLLAELRMLSRLTGDDYEAEKLRCGVLRVAVEQMTRDVDAF